MEHPSSPIRFLILYSKSFEAPPRVYVSAPADPEGVQAEARAILDKRQGFISAIEITNPGSGYNTALAPVTVEVSGCLGVVVVVVWVLFVVFSSRICVPVFHLSTPVTVEVSCVSVLVMVVSPHLFFKCPVFFVCSMWYRYSVIVVFSSLAPVTAEVSGCLLLLLVVVMIFLLCFLVQYLLWCGVLCGIGIP